MIIVPDIHGRVEMFDMIEKNRKEDELIIFLGDYVDPYQYEGHTRKEAIICLEKAIQMKLSQPLSVILLLGNHDMAYVFPNKYEIKSRYDYGNAAKIHKLFEDNLNLFQMTYEDEKGNIYSHAGILPEWIEIHKDDVFGSACTIHQAAGVVNRKLKARDSKFIEALQDVSYYRGGYDNCGSMIWADIKEFFVDYNQEPFQIFGHTQLRKDEPLVLDHCADLDCRHIFRITEENKFDILE